MLTFPNAKINIGLNITEKRPDGYHTIETVFYPIGLCDVLEIAPSTSCTDYSFSSSGIAIGGDPENNLIIKALRLLCVDYVIPPVDISLIKNIPFGAGLGGGSSDAAFMLKALNELFELKLSVEKLEAYALKLGADCPVFIQNKAVFATGIGHIFSDVQVSLDGYFLVLIKPDMHVSTPEAYAKVVPQKPEFDLRESIQLPVSEWKNRIKNDFEPSVFARFPAIAHLKEKLYDAGACYASLSGSGSSVYGLFTHEPQNIGRFENCFVTGGLLKNPAIN